MRNHLTILLLLLAGAGIAHGQLTLPSVPSSLRVPADRADYIAAHFYDLMDWHDPFMTQPEAMMQDWANFLSVLPICHDTVRDSIITATMHRLPQAMIPTYADMADGYLFATDSELCDEVTYIKVLSALATNPYIEKSYRNILDSRLEFLLKNAPGVIATDVEVELTTDEDNRCKLSTLRDRARDILLVFYDPDCEDCHEMLHTLTTAPRWTSKQSQGDIFVVKCEITDETDALFPILTVPSLYLLDGHTLQVKKRNLPLQLIFPEG
ncbi:MAG: DUF5106 domain-containing protein [Clostridiales bacterium]|nr:DUF5106 domain-containing protein [Clostridiales bacterium]